MKILLTLTALTLVAGCAKPEYLVEAEMRVKEMELESLRLDARIAELNASTAATNEKIAYMQGEIACYEHVNSALNGEQRK